MKKLIRSVLVALAATLTLSSTVWAQGAPKANYKANESFELPAKGRPGGPDRPSALAVAANGDVHIADESGAVFVYDRNGAYKRPYGGSGLDRPIGIAAHPNGEFFVLDGGRKQVVVYGANGEVARLISSKGGKAGQLSDPIDMTIGPNGYVYVLDASRRGAVIFSQDGVYIRDVVPGDAVRAPAAVGVGPDGGIYLVDRSTRGAVFRFDPFMELPWTKDLPRGIGSSIGVRGANFNQPVALTSNALGSVLVLDRGSGRVWRVNPFGGQIGTNDLLYGGKGTGRGSFKEPVDIAFAADDEVLILDKDLRKVERIQLATERDLRPRPKSNFPIRVSRGAHPLRIPVLAVDYASDGSPRLALAPNSRTVRLFAADVEHHRSSFGSMVPAYVPNPAVLQRQFSGDFGAVAGVALNDTLAVVVDSRKNRFAVFDIETAALRGTYGDNYQDDRRLRSPSGVALLEDGRIVVADQGNDRVKVFSSDLASLVVSYSVERPAGVSVGPTGAIASWTVRGDWVGVLEPGDESFTPLNPELLPGAIAAAAFDPAGNLLVLDRATKRITVIGASLDHVVIQMGEEDAVGDVRQIVVDEAGNIYLPDRGDDRTLIYRWDVEVPSPPRVHVDYVEDAADLSWTLGPQDFVYGYRIEGAASPRGPYRVIATVKQPPIRVGGDSDQAEIPHYVRVAPVFISGAVGTASDPFPLFNLTIAAAYRRGDYQAAQEEARHAVELINSGALDADNESKSGILYYAFASAYAQRDYNAAVDWAQQLGPVVSSTHVIDFLYKLAEVHMQAGDPSTASQRILALVGQGPRAEYFTNPAVISQSFRIYNALRNAGFAADGLEFLRLYSQGMPATIQDLHSQYRDSIIVFSARYKLGPGFDHWRNAKFGEAVGFFESMLLTAGMTTEEHVLSRQVLAAAYYAFGRRNEAEDTFREIYTVRPGFELDSEVRRVRALYSLTIYNPETRSFFGQLRPRS